MVPYTPPQMGSKNLGTNGPIHSSTDGPKKRGHRWSHKLEHKWSQTPCGHKKSQNAKASADLSNHKVNCKNIRTHQIYKFINEFSKKKRFPAQ